MTKEPTNAAPKMAATPDSMPIEIEIATNVKLVPITTGSLMPITPTPLHWMIVTTPDTSNAALTKTIISLVGSQWHFPQLKAPQ